jgi:cytochrome c-type biogenesis protein CcmH/NrfF
MLAAAVIPSAHLGHWLWVLYVIPLLIVIAGIIRSTLAEKKRERQEKEGKRTKSEY